jgi:ribose 5-phosphate isomerase A
VDHQSKQSGESNTPTVPSSPAQQEAWKIEAVRAAVAAVPDNIVLGLGSGTTAELMLHALAQRVREGLRVLGVPTSERTRDIATSLGIPVTTLDSVGMLDMSIDGADEVLLPSLDLIKGHGGALLREKLIAAASRYCVIVVDASKLARELGAHGPVPVEVIPFGWKHTAERLVGLGARPALRSAGVTTREPRPPSGPPAPYVTDGGNYILDCDFGPIADPAPLAARIKALVGVVDSGLFVGMTERVYVGGPASVQVYSRPQ